MQQERGFCLLLLGFQSQAQQVISLSTALHCCCYSRRCFCMESDSNMLLAGPLCSSQRAGAVNLMLACKIADAAMTFKTLHSCQRSNLQQTL